MPKFKTLKEGVNEKLLKEVTSKVENYLKEILDEDELTVVDGIYSFPVADSDVSITVVPWHTEDVLVEVFSYIKELDSLDKEFMEILLRLNSNQSFGSFGITFDNTVVFSYSLAGANLDNNELHAAVATVATVAGEYEEIIKEQMVK